MFKGMRCWSQTLIILALFAGPAHAEENFFDLLRTRGPQEVQAGIKTGQNVNARDERGETPLMHAAFSNGNSEVVRALIDGAADVNAQAKTGQTALMHAQTPDDLERHGARWNALGKRHLLSPIH